MSFWNIGKFIKKLNTVYNSITSGSLEEMLRVHSNSSSGEIVNAKTSINQSTVFACVRLLSDTTAQLPLKTFNKSDGGGRKEATANPLYSVLMYAPNPSMTPFDYWKYNMSCILLRGYYLSQIIYSSNNKVMELNPIPPETVTKIRRRRDGRLEFTVPQVLKDGANKVLAKKELGLIGGGGSDATAHYCYYATFDGINPASPIQFNKESIGLAITAEKHGATVFKNDATPPMVIKVPGKLSPEAGKRLAKTWMETGSAKGYGMPRVLVGGADFAKISMSNEDAQYLETRKFQKQEIAGGIFGIAPHMVGEVSTAKGWSTLEQQMSEFVILASQPYNVRIEEAIRRDLIPKATWSTTFVKFITNALLRGDIKTRSKFYMDLFGMGAITPNQIRALEDMNPRTDAAGDQYYVSANVKAADGTDDGMSLEERLQKIYLAVDTVVTAPEAREIVNRSGAGLIGPGPTTKE